MKNLQAFNRAQYSIRIVCILNSFIDKNVYLFIYLNLAVLKLQTWKLILKSKKILLQRKT
jgi:hypothetical protein